MSKAGSTDGSDLPVRGGPIADDQVLELEQIF